MTETTGSETNQDHEPSTQPDNSNSETSVAPTEAPAATAEGDDVHDAADPAPAEGEASAVEAPASADAGEPEAATDAGEPEAADESEEAPVG